MKFTNKIAVAVLLVAGMATAAVAETDAIAARQARMKAIGGSLGTLVKMIKGETPFDSTAAKAAVATISEKANGLETLFPAGSDKGDTKAKPVIWTDNAGFLAALTKLQQTAAAQADSVGTDISGVKAAVGALGATCKGCHDTYRESKS
jgi:cytochrome c556